MFRLHKNVAKGTTEPIVYCFCQRNCPHNYNIKLWPNNFNPWPKCERAVVKQLHCSHLAVPDAFQNIIFNMSNKTSTWANTSKKRGEGTEPAWLPSIKSETFVPKADFWTPKPLSSQTWALGLAGYEELMACSRLPWWQNPTKTI